MMGKDALSRLIDAHASLQIGVDPCLLNNMQLRSNLPNISNVMYTRTPSYLQSKYILNTRKVLPNDTAGISYLYSLRSLSQFLVFCTN